MSKWNVRVNWRGKLILRRFFTWMNVDDGREMGEWRDATSEDLRNYFDDMKAGVR